MTKVYTAVAMCILWMSLSKGGVQASNISLCPGEQLNLTCHATPDVTLIQWNLNLPNTSDPEIRFISSGGSAESSASTFTLGQTVFHFSRTSTLPLASLIIINNVTTSLSGTRVDCSYDGSVMSATNINVIGNAIPKPNIVANEIEQFASEAFDILLEWTVQEDIRGLMYNVSISPQVNIQYTGMRNARLSLSYNVPYNVSIAALCGENSSPPLYITLQYGRCVDPLTEAIRQLVSADYNQTPTFEGTNVTFSCIDPQLLLEGPDSATCMENGKWEPDPMDISCIQKDTTSGCIGNPTDADCPSNSESPGVSDSVTDVLNTEVSSQTGAIVGGVLGVLSAVILAFVVILIIGLVYRFRRQKTTPWSNDVQIQDQELEQFSSPVGEYSLLQHSGLRANRATDSAEGGQNLVYADIGPSSRTTRLPVSTHFLDDNHVEYAHLNYQNDAKKTETVEVHSVDNTLNLDSLLIQLQSKVTQKWYEFGKALGVETELLDRYTECTPDQSMVEVCDYWFRSHTGQPTWREVANALKKIKFHQLAIDIEKVYETGKLPVLAKDILEVPFPESEDEPPPPIPPRAPH